MKNAKKWGHKKCAVVGQLECHPLRQLECHFLKISFPTINLLF